MSDTLSAEKRSWNMSRIKGKNTAIEVQVRKYLFAKGIRFRKNDKRYPGKPDIILPKYKTAIFVNGCFWHHHSGCKNATIPKTRTDFWLEKLNKNVSNDEKNARLLAEMGWSVIVLWECELEKGFVETMDCTIERLTTNKEEESTR